MQDFYFGESDLVNGELFIADVEVGDFFVLDWDGEICFPRMKNVNGGVTISSLSFVDDGKYRVKFIANGNTQAQDFMFGKGDLDDGTLFVPNAEPGDFFVIDGTGEICFPVMRPHVKDGVEGTLISGLEVVAEGEQWKIKFIRGMSVSGNSLIKIRYSETGDDGDWHNALTDDDAYMQVSNDGGATWTKPIGLGTSSQGSSSGGSGDEEYTGEYIHNFIVPISSGSTAIDTIVNEMVLPEMWMFCEIMCHYETANKANDGNFHFSYHHWNSAYHPQVFLNGSDVQLNDSMYEIDYKEGVIIPKWEVSPADTLVCTYNFTWFKPETLISFVKRSMGQINYAGTGQPTNYTVDTLPEAWYGISADLVEAMMCEHLILAQTMWYGKLIFAISANDLYNGGGGADIPSNLEAMKRNKEDRAYKALDNENMRAPAYLAKPTPAYWRAVTMGNGIRPGPHGGTYGKTRGIKYNRMIGMTGPDLGI